MRHRRALSALGTVATLLAAAVTATAAPAAAATSTGGMFVPVGQFRALATRTAVRAGHGVTVRIAGRSGVPKNVAAVAITVHAIAPTAAGALTVFASGARRPVTTNLTYARGLSASQAAITRLGGGALTVFNAARSGQTKIAVDVSGYYTTGTPAPGPGALHVLSSPARALDTRNSGRFFRGREARTFRVGHGVPVWGVGAVAVMVSAISPAANGSLVAYAAGNDRPSSPTVSFSAGRATTAFAWVPTHSDGSITVANTSARGVQVVLDVVGWTASGVAQTAGALQPRFPYRLVAATVRANRSATVHVAGRGGVPLANVRAAVVSLIAGSPQRAGALVAYRSGRLPSTRSVLFGAGRGAASLVEVPLTNGAFVVHNLSPGSVRLIADVVGFVPANTITPPHTSTSHYIRNLVHTDTSKTVSSKMAVIGKADAQNGTTLTVLEFGVQTVTPLQGIGRDNPGVLQTGTDERLTYAQVETAVDGYIDGFRSVRPTGSVTIAVGTNNAGVYTGSTAYDPHKRGADWAKLISALRSAPAGLNIVGADDIETSPDFDNSAQGFNHALAWETAYLGFAPQVPLYFNGSADNCPDSFGPVHHTCTPGWTQDSYYRLAHGLSPQRIKALPQVYTISQATQWVNIDRSGGGKIVFAGALTEYQSCPKVSSACPTASYTGASGWSALTRGLATLSGAHPVPAVTDLRIESNLAAPHAVPYS